MDELMQIEENIGEIVGMIGLHFGELKHTIDPEDIQYEEFHEKSVENKQPVLDENGDEVPQEEEPAAEEPEGDGAQVKFKV